MRRKFQNLLVSLISHKVTPNFMKFDMLHPWLLYLCFFSGGGGGLDPHTISPQMRGGCRKNFYHDSYYLNYVPLWTVGSTTHIKWPTTRSNLLSLWTYPCFKVKVPFYKISYFEYGQKYSNKKNIHLSDGVKDH